jgi:alkylated DNA nucleotide flippase Atl1
MPGNDLSGTPQAVTPVSFADVGALEVQHLERWIAAKPELLGERLLVITTQFAGFDRTRDRSDILALDEAGKLVVIELKRESDSRQDLQALRYAAYSATLRVDDLVQLCVAHRFRHGEEITEAEARDVFAEHAADGDIDDLDDDEKPRIILVATDFPVGVTATCLWLRENYELDISCIQLVPYELHGRLLIASSVLIPLPEASAYTVQRDRKRQRSKSRQRIDWGVVKEIVASIPLGNWMSYQDVAVAAGGTPGAAMALGTGLRNRDDIVDGVFRVLNRKGKVSARWQPKNDELPQDPAAVRARLEDEGLTFDAQGRADPARRWSPPAEDEYASDARPG